MIVVRKKQRNVALALQFKCIFAYLIIILVAEGTKDKNGYFQGGRSRSCTYGCAFCQGMNGCIQCKEGLFLYIHEFGRRQKGFCVYRCPSGYYGERSRGSSHCKKCPKKYCEECFDDSYCSKCIYPTYRFKGKCVFYCPAWLDRDEKYRSCVQRRDCKVSKWTRWTPCKSSAEGNTCGLKGGRRNGIKVKERFIIQYPSSRGKKCKRLQKSKPCRLRKCKVGKTQQDVLPKNANTTVLVLKIDKRAWNSTRIYPLQYDANKTEV